MSFLLVKKDIQRLNLVPFKTFEKVSQIISLDENLPEIKNKKGSNRSYCLL